ncbi:hypothetical protein PRZ48_008271 [Zasmidium cellare]|uniref:CENP-V/GFA domain-containing protein n=1 Tax=Zasmidium cellare TaxID=395010 RepID=A0ABR0EG19_ZASCE|nr:hypothetical protein PRZ48_008271 [Zasmidium cellare]
MSALFPYFPLSGAISTYTRSNSKGVTKGFFCTNCGSRIYHLPIDGKGKEADTVALKAGCLVGLDKEMMRGAVHIWTKSAVVDIPEGVESYEEEPPGGSFKEK